MQTVIVGHDSLNPYSWTKHQVEDIRELLVTEFPVWPKHARIYHNTVSLDCDVTPSKFNDPDGDKLAEYDGLLYVINYPGNPILIIAVVAVVAVSAVAFLFMPAIPALKNQQSASPNNALAERTNQPRPQSRIPDPAGTVRSTPDLLAVPYKIFRDNQEREVAYMGVGKGHYVIRDILDDTTPVEQIAGTSVAVYGPYTSPKSGDAPIVQIGDPITEPLVTAKRYSSVNGQVLTPSSGATSYTVNCKFVSPNKIVAVETTGNDGGEPINTDLRQYFENGGSITVNVGTVNGLDLAGTYAIGVVTPTEITLTAPANVKADWNNIAALPGSQTDYITTTLVSNGIGWVGQFIFDLPNLSMIICNLVALNGLRKDDGKNKYPVNVDLQLELTPLNDDNSERGPAELFPITLFGSASQESLIASTLYAQPTFSGKCKGRMRRITPKDTAFKGTIIDEVKWRDVYAVAPIEQSDFGDITTVFCVTAATEGALSQKDRKLNMLITRKMPVGTLANGQVTFSADLQPTNYIPDILTFFALDPYVGNRQLRELDIVNFYETAQEVVDYFGTSLAAEFCYTFDKDNLTFEETVAAIASALFSIAYRRGRLISLFFEKETDDSTLIFNHRNKLPKSEVRTYRFDNANDYDGVEYQYVDPADDAIVTYYIPEDRSAVKPKKIESLGIRNPIQAYFNAWRAWYKIVYQNCTVEFDATSEADILILQQRIRVADNTRTGTQDGQLKNQEGLVLTLSQPFVAKPGVTYTIFIQHVDGNVETLPVTAGNDSYTALLSQPPRAALSLDPNNFAVALYWIVGNNEPRGTAFLLSEKRPKANLTLSLKAINYDKRYYSKDKDFASSFVNEDGTNAIYTEDGLTLEQE
jgi:hypothetical protein